MKYYYHFDKQQHEIYGCLTMVQLKLFVLYNLEKCNLRHGTYDLCRLVIVEICSTKWITQKVLLSPFHTNALFQYLIL